MEEHARESIVENIIAIAKRKKEKLLKELIKEHLGDCTCALCMEHVRLVRANMAQLHFYGRRIIRGDHKD